MNDDQKTKEQLLEELAQGRALLERAEERSLALQEVSKRVAAAHDTDEVLDLIVNEAARLLGASGSFLMFPDEGELVAGAATESAATFVDGITEVRPKIAATAEASPISRVMVTKEPWTTEDAQVDEKVTPLGRRSCGKLVSWWPSRVPSGLCPLQFQSTLGDRQQIRRRPPSRR